MRKNASLTPAEISRLESSLARAKDGTASAIDVARVRGHLARVGNLGIAEPAASPSTSAPSAATTTPTPAAKPAPPAGPAAPTTAQLREMAGAVFGRGQLSLANDESDRRLILTACWQSRLQIPGITPATLDALCAGAWRLPDERFCGLARALSASAQERLDNFFAKSK